MQQQKRSECGRDARHIASGALQVFHYVVVLSRCDIFLQPSTKVWQEIFIVRGDPAVDVAFAQGRQVAELCGSQLAGIEQAVDVSTVGADHCPQLIYELFVECDIADVFDRGLDDQEPGHRIQLGRPYGFGCGIGGSISGMHGYAHFTGRNGLAQRTGGWNTVFHKVGLELQVA